MKYNKLKKQVLIETAIISAVTIVLAAIIYLISAIDDDYVAGNATLQQQVDIIDLEMNKLRNKYDNILQHMAIYQEVQKKQSEGRLAINRPVGMEKFNQFKNLYALSGLHLTASPAQDVKDAGFKRQNGGVNFSDVTMNFDVVSDENVYELLDSLRDDLPGMCKLVKISMLLQKPLNEEALQAISQKGTFPMIRAEIRFIWFGINAIEIPDGKADAVKK